VFSLSENHERPGRTLLPSLQEQPHFHLLSRSVPFTKFNCLLHTPVMRSMLLWLFIFHQMIQSTSSCNCLPPAIPECHEIQNAIHLQSIQAHRQIQHARQYHTDHLYNNILDLHFLRQSEPSDFTHKDLDWIQEIKNHNDPHILTAWIYRKHIDIPPPKIPFAGNYYHYAIAADRMLLSNPYRIILAASLTFQERHIELQKELFCRLKLHVGMQLYGKSCSVMRRTSLTGVQKICKPHYTQKKASSAYMLIQGKILNITKR
jgi:hypothetical protein